MRRTDRPFPSTSTDARAAGWIVSLLLHGTLAFGVFVFAQQITTRSQPGSFTWNVAMVTPPTPATPAAAASAQRSAPPVAKPAKPVPTNAEAAMRPLESSTPIAHAPIPASTLPQPTTENIPSPVAEQTALARTTDHDLSRQTPTPHPPALNAPPQPMASTSGDSVIPSHDEPAAVSQDTTQSQQIAALAPSSHTSTKPDYGWLIDDVEKWSEQIYKFLPPEFRFEGIEGRVKLRFLIREDGVVSDVRIAESSGNARLDQAAIEAVRKTPPVNLSRPLGRPHKLVTLPYSFRVGSAR